MTATSVNICVGGELEARAQSVLANWGLDVPTAVNIFLTQVVDRETLPFEVDEAKAVRKKPPKRGGWEGKTWMAEDFDEPLELLPEKPAKLPFGRGCMKGKMWMADDFDAPLEDFREYME